MQSANQRIKELKKAYNDLSAQHSNLEDSLTSLKAQSDELKATAEEEKSEAYQMLQQQFENSQSELTNLFNETQATLQKLQQQQTQNQAEIARTNALIGSLGPVPKGNKSSTTTPQDAAGDIAAGVSKLAALAQTAKDVGCASLASEASSKADQYEDGSR